MNKANVNYPRAVDRYVNHLDVLGLRQSLAQLLLHPESRDFLVGCIAEHDKCFSIPKVKAEFTSAEKLANAEDVTPMDEIEKD